MVPGTQGTSYKSQDRIGIGLTYHKKKNKSHGALLLIYIFPKATDMKKRKKHEDKRMKKRLIVGIEMATK